MGARVRRCEGANASLDTVAKMVNGKQRIESMRFVASSWMKAGDARKWLKSLETLYLLYLISLVSLISLTLTLGTGMTLTSRRTFQPGPL